jgi:hypothetical protein
MTNQEQMSNIQTDEILIILELTSKRRNVIANDAEND